ncbi:MAG: hypothetical protein IVW51_11945 [Thermaceae bacterium]|nr:hypothetical protein [Thermaceae bacterium]
MNRQTLYIVAAILVIIGLYSWLGAHHPLRSIIFFVLAIAAGLWGSRQKA